MITAFLRYLILPLLILSLLFVWLIDLMRLRDVPRFSRSDFSMMQGTYEQFVYDAIISNPDCYRGGGCSDERDAGPGGCRRYQSCDSINKSMERLAINNLFVTSDSVSFYADDMYGHESETKYKYVYDEKNYRNTLIYTGDILLTGNRYYKIIDNDSLPVIDTGYLYAHLEDYSSAVSGYFSVLENCKNNGCKKETDAYYDIITKLFLSYPRHRDDHLIFYVGGTGSNEIGITRSNLILKYITNKSSRDERVQRAEKITNAKEYLTSLNGRRELPDEIILDQIVRFFVLVPKITFIASFLR